MRGRFFALATLLACAAVLASCGGSSGNEDTASACFSGPETYLKALDTAPGQVRLEGTTPISDCLVSGQDAGALASAGGAMVVAATRLNAAGRADPAGAAPLQLGYLVGAADRGAAGTAGIHADLLRRLESAARFGGDAGLTRRFDRAYREGETAGRTGG